MCTAALDMRPCIAYDRYMPLPAETPHPLAQEAITRMSDYQLAEFLAYERAEEHDTLNLGCLASGDGTIVTLQSGLLAPDMRMRNSMHVDETGQLVRRVEFSPMTAFADLVGLWPAGNHGQGEAALYSVRLPLEPDAPVYSRSFVDATRGVIGTHRGLLLGFGFTFYRQLEGIASEEGEVLYGREPSDGNTILATAETQVHVKELGVNELDDERAIRVGFTGPASTQLQRRHFMRLAPQGLFATADEETTVAVDIPDDYEEPDSLNAAVRLGMAQSLVKHESGVITPEGKSPSDDDNARYRHFNPRLSDSDLLKFVTELPYEDITPLFLERYASELIESMPGDYAAPARDILVQAKTAIEERLRHPLYPQEPIGCLAIAAMLRDGLPDLGEGFLMDPSEPGFFVQR